MSQPVKIKVKILLKKPNDSGKTSENSEKTSNQTNEIVVPVNATESKNDSNEILEQGTCSICIENFTAKLRRCIKCPYCSETICAQCLEKYLLNTIEDPHCVSCRRGWSQSLLQTFCTKTFLTKTYADYRSNILLNRSKSYLPRYQEQAERVRAAQRMRGSNRQYQQELDTLNEDFRTFMTQYEKKRDHILRTMNNINNIAFDIETGRRNVEGEVINDQNTSSQEPLHERKKFIRRCPSDGCNGFLSSVWKCGLCANWTCPDCFVVKGLNKDVEHTCRQEDKATADEIRKRTKPCPNCGELIEKSDGCDQMFCTSCHSPFSWNRGEIIKTGVIHNPHYFEWLQRNGGSTGGRHHADIPCGGLPGYQNIFRNLNHFMDLTSENKKRITLLSNAYRACAHIIDVERQHWTAHTIPNTEHNTKLGVSFLLGNITENEWRAKLKLDERNRIKSKEVRDILDAFNNASIDIWRQIDDKVIKCSTRSLGNESYQVTLPLEEWIKQLEQLRSFINPPLWEISRIYNCQVPQIDEEFNFKLSSVSKERKLQRRELKQTQISESQAEINNPAKNQQ